MTQDASIFPEHNDPHFARKLTHLEEYMMFAHPPQTPVKNSTMFEQKVKDACSGFEKAMYQHLMQHYLSRRSPYRSLLLFHGLGVGKTCSSITIAESFLQDHSVGMAPRILVVSPIALKKSYEDQIFSVTRFLDDNPEQLRNQCTSDTYVKLIHGNPPKDVFLRRIQQLIRGRYHFITYDRLVSYVEEHPKVTDMVVIVDEAHNLRHQETEKKAADALETLLENGERNRLVLLSATPMYNEPNEILWLLKLLLKNDQRNTSLLPSSLYKKDGRLDRKASKILAQLSQEYISYIRGKNPFTFAARVSPSRSGIPVAGDAWARFIEDGIVLSPLGIKQKDGGVVEEETAVKRAGSSPKQLQWLNVTYPQNSHGEKGFDRMFDRVGDPFPVMYRALFKNRLMPSPGNLEMVASKLQTVSDFVRKADGIVLIYSQFVWSGVVPMAIVLEHMGFRRYGGTDMLQHPELIDAPVKYPGISLPQYCILSGDANVMGSSKIEALRRVINNADNSIGQRIKVVLITPVAGEGLSFQNVREVHILDPWYHMNRMEQVIGRAIRTCSHQTLPIEKRNVSVFLHAVVGSKGGDTADIHALKIAARKWQQTKEIETIIRDHAMDCSLQYHLNYMSKDMFPLEVLMQSSQGAMFSYQFGDEITAKPACDPLDPLVPLDTKTGSVATVPSHVYAALIPTALRRLEKFIQTNIGSRLYFDMSELVTQARMTKHDIVYAALKQSVYPHQWIDGYDMFFHMGGVVFVPRQLPSPQKELALPQTKREPFQLHENTDDTNTQNVSPCDPESILRSIPPNTDVSVATLMFYMFMDSHCWSDVAQYMIMNQTSPIVKTHIQVLLRTGAFIEKRELSRNPVPPNASGNAIGYVDIFQKDKFIVYLWDKTGFRIANDAEVRALQRTRKQWTKMIDTSSTLYGVMEPFKFSKAADAPLRATLKLMLPGPTVGKRRGVVCSSNKKKDLQNWLQEMGHSADADGTDTKEQMCFSIALSLLRSGKLLLYPEWKPI